VLFGVASAVVPIGIAAALTDLAGVIWWQVCVAVTLVAVSSAFLGLFVAVSVSEVFEAQTFSNFFRFPMVFLCGLFFPIDRLPWLLKPLSYAMPLTYGTDLLHEAFNGAGRLPAALSVVALLGFCALLFALSIHNVRRKWIL
jgi:ABC-2 type transport system permease protein